MMINLQEFINKNNHLGTMRFDFANGEKAIANSWYSNQQLNITDVSEIQPYVNDVMFNRFNTFTKITDECKGFNYSDEKVLYEETTNFIYAIKLVPVQGEYNGYIYVYRKPEKISKKIV